MIIGIKTAVAFATILSVAAASKQADPQKLLKNYKAFLTENGKDLARLKDPKRLQVSFSSALLFFPFSICMFSYSLFIFLLG